MERWQFILNWVGVLLLAAMFFGCITSVYIWAKPDVNHCLSFMTSHEVQYKCLEAVGKAYAP